MYIGLTRGLSIYRERKRERKRERERERERERSVYVMYIHTYASYIYRVMRLTSRCESRSWTAT